MNLKTRKLFLLAPLLCLTGCLMQGERPSSVATGGLRLIPVTEELLAKNTTGDASNFDLGDVDASFQQYFILQNAGGAPVTNVHLSTDHPNLRFSPAVIPVLPPSAGLSMAQVVKLNVQHGRRLDAEGWGGLLPPGALEALLTVTGESNATPLALEAGVRLNARVMNAEVYDEGLAIGFATPNAYVLGGSMFPVAQAIPVYTAAGHARIVNTGNVPLVIRRWKAGAAFDSLVLAPGAQHAPEVETFSTNLTGFELDARGVVSDPFKFARLPDGRFFFWLTRPLD